ncbi:MAG TPA: ATP-binding cassette domain-containing protein, partial [Accumulibacter sp.]|nr:ATP-binding cassette domain-containing protein [Accumulibacter sp.]
MPTENLVEIKDLDFAYEDRPILQGISLDIPRGKVVAMMGGSGCGKTTLLRLIGGQLRPSRGQIRVDGQSVPALNAEELYALRRRMGMLFQFGA